MFKRNLLIAAITSIAITACNQNGIGGSSTNTSSKTNNKDQNINLSTNKCLFKGGVSSLIPDVPTSMAKGTTYQAKMTLRCGNNAVYDVTDKSALEANNPNIIAISKTKLLQAKTIGNTELTYSYLHSLPITSKIQVSNAKLEDFSIYSDDTSFNAGYDVTVKAYGIFSDQSYNDNLNPELIKWTSSDNSVATVQNGKIALLKKGFATITASYEGKEAKLNLTVNDAVLQDIEIVPTNINIDPYINSEIQISAKGIYSDKTSGSIDNDALHCSSSNNTVAQFSSEQNCLLELIKEPKKGEKLNITVEYKGKKQTKDVTLGDGNISELKLDLSADNLLPNSSPRKYHIMAKSGNDFYDVTDALQLVSSESDIISVKNKEIRALKPGKAILKVSFKNVNEQEISVEKAVTVGSIDANIPETIPAQVEQAISVKTIDHTGALIDKTDEATITSDDSNIAVITSDKKIKTINNGTTTIHIVLPNGMGSVTKKITVANIKAKEINFNAPDSITLQNKAALTLLVTFEDNTKFEVANKEQIAWSISKGNAAEISKDGLLSPKAIGVVEITAKYAGLTASNSVNIDQAELSHLIVEPSKFELVKNDEFNAYYATAVFADKSSMPLDFKSTVDKPICQSSDMQKFTVDSNCKITAKSSGTANLVIQYHSKSINVPVSVFDALPPAKHIVLQADLNNFLRGETRSYKINLISNHNITYDATRYLSITSSDVNKINVVNGKLEAKGVGSAKLTVNYNGTIYDLATATIIADKIVSAKVELYSNDIHAQSDKLMPHKEYDIKITSCSTNSGRVITNTSECDLNLNLKNSSGTANIKNNKLTPLLAGNIFLTDSKYGFEYPFTIQAVRNPDYEMSAGSFSQPFDKVNISDEYAGCGYSIDVWNNTAHNAATNQTKQALERQGRYGVIDALSLRMTDNYTCSVHWYEAKLSAQTNRPIPVSYPMSTNGKSYVCSIPNGGIWKKDGKFSTANLSADANSASIYSSKCVNIQDMNDVRNDWNVYHNSDAIRTCWNKDCK